MRKVEHIGIAVSDIEKATERFTKIFGRENYKSEIVESEQVQTSFFQIGECKIELIGATSSRSPISKYLEKEREGIHHIAFYVDDIEKEILRLTSLGVRLLNEIPKKGADNKLICFLHPKDTNGVLIEICQNIDE